MSTATSIEWTEITWNPTSGCDRVSPGCDHCYALTLAKRLKAMGQPKYQTDGDPRTSGPGFGVAVHPDVLTEPLRWHKPRKCFVDSMADLFHDDVPDQFIARVFAVMAAAPQHTFQMLTKRPGRMASLMRDVPRHHEQFQAAVLTTALALPEPHAESIRRSFRWPLPNVWLGTSVENQKWADVRVPLLLRTPAAVRFLSCEPLLGPVDVRRWLPGGDVIGPLGAEPGLPTTIGIDWVIVGGESGPKARPMHPQWARDLRDQCQAAGTAYFFKQWGRWRPINEQAEMPSGIGCPVFDQHGVEVDFRRLGADWPGFDAAREFGWQMFHAAGKHAAGRELNGRTWDEYPREVVR